MSESNNHIRLRNEPKHSAEFGYIAEHSNALRADVEARLARAETLSTDLREYHALTLSAIEEVVNALPEDTEEQCEAKREHRLRELSRLAEIERAITERQQDIKEFRDFLAVFDGVHKKHSRDGEK